MSSAPCWQRRVRQRALGSRQPCRATLCRATGHRWCHDTPCHGTGHAVTPCAAPAVLHSGEYFLFESDSEEEEEAMLEEPRPGRQSAFQVSVAGVLGGVSWCPWGTDSPSFPPPTARLPGLGDQHQDGAAAAGADGGTRCRGRCRWVWLTPKWG